MKCIVCGINDAYKFGRCRDCLSNEIKLKTEKMEITECPKYLSLFLFHQDSYHQQLNPLIYYRPEF